MSRIPDYVNSMDELGDKYVPSDDEIRDWCRERLNNLDLGPNDINSFFEFYVDPEGPFRYGGGDTEDAIDYVLRYDPRTIADAIVAYEKECL